MQFQKGNKFWLAQSSHGRNPIFSNPEQLRNACYEYSEWVEENPLYEENIARSPIFLTSSKKLKMLSILRSLRAQRLICLTLISLQES